MNIIPCPVRAAEYDGCFIIDSKTGISGAFANTAKFLVRTLKNNNGISLDSSDDILFVSDSSLEYEEYILEVNEKGIRITASNDAGAFYAVSTLRQISLSDSSGICSCLRVPCCTIADKPRYKLRSFMFDVARHFFDLDYLKKTIDMMALLKLNTLHLHLSDDQGWRVEIKKYPLLTSKGSVRKSTPINTVDWSNNNEARIYETYGVGMFYTQNEIRELVAYAAERHINIIPEIDMPGHLTAASACYPELSCKADPVDVSARFGVADRIGCAGGEALYRFAKDIIDELTELFPYEYYHIGGDEVPKGQWQNCPVCQQKIKDLGLKNENELQGHFNNEIQAYLASKNKKMIGWNEILEASILNDDTVVQWWFGDHKENGVLDWMKKGNNIILSHSPFLYMDHFYSMKDLRLSYSCSLKTLEIDEKYDSQVLGIEAPVWTEYVRDTKKLEFNIYPRLMSLSEINWTSEENKDFDSFCERLEEFFKILDRKKMYYAPREAYLLEGEEGEKRAGEAWSIWEKDPYFEMEHYIGEVNK